MLLLCFVFYFVHFLFIYHVIYCLLYYVKCTIGIDGQNYIIYGSLNKNLTLLYIVIFYDHQYGAIN